MYGRYPRCPSPVGLGSDRIDGVLSEEGDSIFSIGSVLGAECEVPYMVMGPRPCDV